MIFALTVAPRVVAPVDEDDEAFLPRDAVAPATDILDREAIDLARYDWRFRLGHFDHPTHRDRSLGAAGFADEEGELAFFAEVSVRPFALGTDHVLVGVPPDPLGDRVLGDAGLEHATGQVEHARAAKLPGQVADQVGRLAPEHARDLLQVPDDRVLPIGHHVRLGDLESIAARTDLRQLGPGPVEEFLVSFHSAE